MNRKTLFTAGCFAMLQAGAPDTAAAQGSSAARAQEITRAGTQAPAAGPAEFFTGPVRVQPVQMLGPGDVVWCRPGVKHWHGASLMAAMSHLAVTGTREERT